METGLAEPLQPVDVGELCLVEQKRAEEPVSVHLCDLQSMLDVHQGPAPLGQQEGQETCIVDSCSLQSMVDVRTALGQQKAGQLLPVDFHGLQSMLDAQRDKIHQQLQELQKVVVLQCRITGTNPLAQEMAAAVLEKRIGKRFGDSLTPKALKCLYNVFSIKDTITKKEAREISALCGATVTQVREFFAGQRSRVRKVVQSSHIDQGSDDTSLRLPSIQLDQATIDSHHTEDTLSLSSQQVESTQCNHLLLLNSFHGKADGISTKLHAVEKAEHLINVMHKESTFTGQSHLAQVIMQAHDSVLRCYMARGGLQQIIKWLIQAAAEEQTSLIRLILKAITQLPLGSAQPRHMSLLLQTVNKLRFYRAQDVASRARLLLARWSRFFKSNQSGKMVSFSGLARSSQPGQKRSRDSTISCIIDDSSKKKVKAGNIVDSGQSLDVVSSSVTEDKAVHERDEPETVCEVNKTKKRLGSFLIQGDRAKEKRKVQLFEEARAAIRRKDGDGTKSSTFGSSSRPLSADDIKKAKRRAQFLNHAKSQKPFSSREGGTIMSDLSAVSSQRGQRNISKFNGGLHEPLSVENCSDSTIPLMEGEYPEGVLKLRSDPKVSGVLPGQPVGAQMLKKGKTLSVINRSVQNDPSHRLAEAHGIPRLGLNPLEPSMGVKQSERRGGANVMDMPSILWTTPPKIALDPRWKTASGEHSTEVLSESKRLSSELEAIYTSPQCIPPNPEEPAERVCLFVDDTLVPELLLEVLDEESQERDCSLQSPRDFESAKVRGEEADSHKSITHIDVKSHVDVRCSDMKDIDRSVELEMAFKDKHTLEVSRTNDQHSSLLSVTADLNCNKAVKKVSSATDPGKNCCVGPSELTLATPVDQACMQVRETEFCNSEAYEQGRGAPFLQLKNKEAVPICRVQTLAESSTAIKASETEPFSVLAQNKDITNTPQKDCDKASSSSATNMEVPLLLDHLVNASSGSKTSGVDLSELSKEACLDMLNIVLQQLADNAKGSGADLELLSVFLKNPQLVYSLMPSLAGPSAKGLPSACTGRDLSEIIQCSTIEDFSSQLEKLVCRNIDQVAYDAREMEKAGPYMSQVMQPVSRPPIAVAGPQSHPSPSMTRSLAVVDPAVQLSDSQSKVFDSTQFLKHPLSSADISSNSSDYDWSQPYDYPSSCMQQGAGLPRHPMHTPITVDRCSNISAYSQNPPAYTQSPMARASQSQNPSAIPTLSTQPDRRVQSSMLVYGGGHGRVNPSMLHVERQESDVIRKNSFSVVDVPNVRLLQASQARGAGISDGILPVPDAAANNHRVHPSKVIYERQSLHGGKVPAFVPEVRGSSTVVGNQMPPHLNNGHPYSDQNFRPQSASSSRPPYVPHGLGSPSFITNPIRPQGNPFLWRPPPSHSNRSRHVRPGWREG
eukprot:c22366_g1_i1 orf=365-4585(+)